ncbi:MAG TPA: citramalate synthase, partial [Ruminococcaceae bacterium]|nr:citramalate synthase [Oscillospiraceae bacterium]
FGKCWDMHVTEILGASLDENLKMIEEICRYFAENDRLVIFDAEHFFDGYKRNPDYAVSAVRAAVKGGARCAALCDTNGGMFPDETAEAVRHIASLFPNTVTGIHCHNDGGMAVANSIMAVKAGVSHVQGTFLGFGERCGNASLSAIIPNLQLKCGYACIPKENMRLLTGTARSIAETANISLRKNEPYVGLSAFAHKAGMHADGVLKNSVSFEHIEPETVGNERRFLMSEMSGRTAVTEKIQKFTDKIDRDSPKVYDIIKQLKRLEHLGYQFEGAEASFELLVRRELETVTPSFELVSYRVLDENPYEDGHSATATLKIKAGGQTRIAAADGDGPVNALDLALRNALLPFYPQLEKVHLIDYKVRVMDPKQATGAVVRVLITSADGDNIWTTVGVSSDVIEASWIALVDSIEYRLNCVK